MPFSIHEEAQVQSYYRMKADYFHFSGMVDPNLLLVGSRDKWSAADLKSEDVRANDSAFMEFGFDFGRWACATSCLCSLESLASTVLPNRTARTYR
ncbi:MAG: hypothetical protein HC883_00750 [Bdellovibrionaceae bacterium]|nr:hypothetical protein [Pseudobdellovibrionaceae bacterium]